MNGADEKKKSINIVLLGNVDSGKSTSIGHLMHLLGFISERVIDRNAHYAEEIQKLSYKYAWIFDTLRRERERGITMEVKEKNFETRKWNVTAFDVPGLLDFQKNTNSGISQGDIGILFIDATKVGFEWGLSHGTTRDHILKSYVMGLKQMIVVVNKMDDNSVRYSLARFKEIRGVIRKTLKTVGYNLNKVPFIPISGYKGENLVENSPNMPWWKNVCEKWGGMTFVQVLDSMKYPKRPIHFPLRIPVLNSFKLSGVGTVLTGRVETGTISVGQKVMIAPLGKTVKVKSLEKHHTKISKAFPGDSIGVSFEEYIRHYDVRRGFMIGDACIDPPLEVERFVAMIIVTGHPGRIRVGYEPMVDFRTNHCLCKVEEIIRKVDKSTKEPIEENPEFLKRGDCAIVMMRPTSETKVKIYCDPYDRESNMGRMLMRDLRMTVAVGVVQKVFKCGGKGWCDRVPRYYNERDSDEKERREYILDHLDDRCCSKIQIGFLMSERSITVWKSLLV